jgi:hypothetical protein
MIVSAKQAVEIYENEIHRLRKLCEDNGIDPTPPKNPQVTMSVTPKVTVFKTLAEAEEYQRQIT